MKPLRNLFVETAIVFIFSYEITNKLSEGL
jgi:hypothetical protein